jgi:monooxygenase
MKDFSPSYGPWEQRLCFVPDGDFYKALNSGKAEIVTDTIERFTESGIELRSGRSLPADIVISATGLNLKFLGGVSIRLDGVPVDLPQTVPYKGAMLSGIPNLGMAFGYTNASWTLKCDLICEWLAKVIRYMSVNHYAVVTPEGDPNVERVPLIDFSSGYFQRARNILPRQGTRSPWKLNQNYFADLLAFRARRLGNEGLKFSKA